MILVERQDEFASPGGSFVECHHDRSQGIPAGETMPTRVHLRGLERYNATLPGIARLFTGLTPTMARLMTRLPGDGASAPSLQDRCPSDVTT